MYFSVANAEDAAGPGCDTTRSAPRRGRGGDRITLAGAPGRPDPRRSPHHPPSLAPEKEGERLLRLCLVKLVMYHVNYHCDLKMVAGSRKINGNPNSNYVAGVKELN